MLFLFPTIDVDVNASVVVISAVPFNVVLHTKWEKKETRIPNQIHPHIERNKYRLRMVNKREKERKRINMNRLEIIMLQHQIQFPAFSYSASHILASNK